MIVANFKEKGKKKKRELKLSDKIEIRFLTSKPAQRG
jgi:hypothetical protein